MRNVTCTRTSFNFFGSNSGKELENERGIYRKTDILDNSRRTSRVKNFSTVALQNMHSRLAFAGIMHLKLVDACRTSGFPLSTAMLSIASTSVVLSLMGRTTNSMPPFAEQAEIDQLRGNIHPWQLFKQE